MRTVDLIHRKRDGEELSPEEISFLINGYTSGQIPDYQMSAFLMSVFFSGMTDREVDGLTEAMDSGPGEVVDLTLNPASEIDMHSTAGVGDQTSLIASHRGSNGCRRSHDFGTRARPHGRTLDSSVIPGFRTA
jgi:thymidine phosphorylase